MPQKVHTMHGRDHCPGGADPIPCMPPAPTNRLDELILTDPCLVGFWKLNELAGDTAVDSGPGGYDLTSGAFDPPNWGQAAGPPGTVTAGFASGLGENLTTFPALTGDLTAEIWFYRTDTDHHELIGQGTPGSGSGWFLTLESAIEGLTNRPHLAAAPSAAAIEADNAISTNTWYHLAATRTSGTWRMYVNGVVQSATGSGTYTPSTGIYIGNLPPGGGVSMVGNLSYAAVYDCALTADQLLEHYTTAGALSEEGWVLRIDEDGNAVWAPAGVPVGGTTGQVLTKDSGTDWDTSWQDPASSDPADDVLVWMPLTTTTGGVPELVWDGDDELIPTLVTP